jgi:hypothetical protein
MSVRSETRMPIRLFNKMASALSGNPSKFYPDQLLETAQKKYGLLDFGGNAFLDGLQVLCKSLNTESNLHPFGRLAAGNALLGTLRNRLELAARWSEYPEVLETPVERPVLIVGPPRTGTTLLFNLLALDDRFRFIRSWEAGRPGLPQDDRKAVKSAKNNCKRHINGIYYLRPELKKIHYLAPDEPEECIPLLANSFESDFYAFAYKVRSYFDWYIDREHLDCYTYYRKQLQWIQSKTPGKRWLLKSPAHLAALKSLFAVFPDALVLQTHRDPRKIVPSISNLKYNFQSMFTYEVDREHIGKTAVDFLSKALEAVFEHRKENEYNMIDIRYEDLVRDPVDILKQVYQHMGERLIPWKNALRSIYPPTPRINTESITITWKRSA